MSFSEKEGRLGDYISLVIDNRGKTPPLSDSGHELIETTSIVGSNKYPDYGKITKFVNDETYNTWFRRGHPVKGDLLISTVGLNIGNVSIVKSNRGCIAQNLVGLRPNASKLDSDFLYYFLTQESIQYTLKNLNIGSAQPSIKVPHLLNLKCRFPDKKIQRNIASLLTALDDKITLLCETNATLEAIAQALFKSWFVDFDPVRAKQQGREPEGMDEATTALFSGSFEESELGLVPNGWRVGSLIDFAILNPESWTAKQHPNTVAYIDLANAKDNEIAEVAEYAFDAAPSRARRVLRGGDTIVGTVRPGNRSFAFIHQAASNLTASTGFAVLWPRKKENTEYVYLTATQDSSIDHLAHVADGGAYPAVRPEIVVGISCILPCESVMTAFHDLAAPLLASIAEYQCRAQTLANLRDTLLPRLISGQLRLPESESVIEEAI